MPHRLLELLQERCVIFDGAMGTQLMEAGLAAGEAPEVWNETHPAAVLEIHRRYYEAGADVVHTNTFGGNPLKLADRGLGHRMRALNLAAARLAREACPAGGLVAGDLGPSGKMLAPLGDTTAEELSAAFMRQTEALLEGGVDLISIETMFSLEEALAALEGAKMAGASLVSVCVTYTRTKKGFFTMMGESLSQCVRALEEAGADIIGTNCTLGSGDMVELVAAMRALTAKPLLAQPNAGKPRTVAGATVYDQPPEDFARDAVALREAGADLLGGCCGTDPAFIRALAGALHSPR